MPVLESVAAILRQMMPDLPMPVTIDAAAAVEQDADRLLEALVEAIDERQDRRRFRLQDLAREREVDAGDAAHARAPEAATAPSRAAASIRFSFRISASSRSRRSALAASLFAARDPRGPP